MLSFFLWYFIITLVGWVAFPLAYRLLPALPDRGYAISRGLGLLIWGYFFWMLGSLGILRNDVGGLLLSFLLMVGLVIWSFKKITMEEIRSWVQVKKGIVLGVEILFFVAFAGWTLVRATNPEILGTEKPMELAFVNAILRSPLFPPHDPWLSGYAISYYYFGYVLVAMLAKISAVSGSVAFNLGISLVFALSAIGAYGVIYNLLEVAIDRLPINKRSSNRSVVYALLGPFFVLIVSNLEGFLEVLNARGLFWQQNTEGIWSSRLWSWLDIQDLTSPPGLPLSWIPSRFYWWWRASRVLQDYDLAGASKEIIDEFPFFSYLLADLHPHVLAMPFAFLAISITFGMFFGSGRENFPIQRLRLNMSLEFFLLAALVLGGMAFLNTWDFPIFLALFCAAYALREALMTRTEVSMIDTLARMPGKRVFPSLLRSFIVLSLVLGMCGILLYLPFYLGFSSQVGGILPNLIYPTRGVHLWLMFGPFWLLLLAYLIYLWKTEVHASLVRGLICALGFAFGLWLLSVALGWLIINIPLIRDIYLGSLGATGPAGELWRAVFTRRMTNLGWVTLVGFLGVTLTLLWPVVNETVTHKKDTEERANTAESGEPSHSNPCLALPSEVFILLLILGGVLLILIPEFFYLRDQFGWRINTIFKFYYQAWLLLGLATAFATAWLLLFLRGIWKKAFSFGLLLLLGMALVYPVLGLWNKTNGFDPPGGYTLDGMAYFAASSPEDMAGIAWLHAAPPGVVLEAVGGSYSEYARVATLSGQPNVLGWPGHESQWRGGGEEIGSRQSDVELIYRSNDWEKVKQLLDLYNVRYVYVGPLERRTYRVSEAKFMQFLTPVFQQGQVSIYEVPREMDVINLQQN